MGGGGVAAAASFRATPHFHYQSTAARKRILKTRNASEQKLLSIEIMILCKNERKRVRQNCFPQLKEVFSAWEPKSAKAAGSIAISVVREDFFLQFKAGNVHSGDIFWKICVEALPGPGNSVYIQYTIYTKDAGFTTYLLYIFVTFFHLFIWPSFSSLPQADKPFANYKIYRGWQITEKVFF